MCYPHGNYNADTLDVAGEFDCRLGLTTRPGVVADLSRPLELPRFDTTDLPCHGDASMPDRLMAHLVEPSSVVSDRARAYEVAERASRN